MKIDTAAFIKSLPIMGIGLLGIFIVTAVIILGIYILRFCTSKNAAAEAASEASAPIPEKSGDSKESAMDLLKEREKNDFLESDDTYTISNDL